MALFMAGTTFGPVLGPIIGGYLDPIGWRWAFWVSLMIAGATCVVLVFVPESYGPVLLKRKARRMRKETGDNRIVAPFELEERNMRHIFTVVLTRPLRMFFFECEPWESLSRNKVTNMSQGSSSFRVYTSRWCMRYSTSSSSHTQSSTSVSHQCCPVKPKLIPSRHLRIHHGSTRTHFPSHWHRRMLLMRHLPLLRLLPCPRPKIEETLGRA